MGNSVGCTHHLGQHDDGQLVDGVAEEVCPGCAAPGEGPRAGRPRGQAVAGVLGVGDHAAGEPEALVNNG